ncbi:MAG TPA: phage/plasmid primase, P4 family, partial [Candidatus Caenarcaniphilales bacterium]
MYATKLESTSFQSASPVQLEQVIKERLDAQHYQELKASGLSDEQILATGHYSIRNVQEGKKVVGVKHKGLAFRYLDPWGKPYTRTDGRAFYRIKPSDWAEHHHQDIEDGDAPPKYLTAAGEGNKPYFSPLSSYWQRDIKRSKYDLDFTEGEKKADSACAHGIPTIGLSGVYGWLDKLPRPGEIQLPPAQLVEDPYDTIAANHNLQLEDSRPLPELSVIALEHRRCNLVFDSDIIHKLPVKQAQFTLALWLQSQKARPYIVLLPNELDGSKNGVDDFIVRHGIRAYKKLRDIAQPALMVSKKGIRLNLPKDPIPRNKAVMVWAVLKEHWAYRPGTGWYHWEQQRWKLRTVEEFEADLLRFMDAQGWEDRGMNVMNTVVRQARSQLLVPNECWNPENKLAFSNGTLDLETEQFSNDHRPSNYLTSVLPYDYDLQAQCPIWLKFLQEALGGDNHAVELLRAFIKYILLPKPKDRKAEIEKSLDLVGPPGTGKGTVLDIIEALVGSENCGAVGKETFKSPAALANLIDTKVAVDRDAAGFLGDIGLFNKIVSNEPVPLKRLYRDVISTRLCTVLVRAYNKFLDVPDGSEGLNRRIIGLEFSHIPQIIDTELRSKLQAELAGIFTWAWSITKSEMKRYILWAGMVPTVAEASTKRFEANNPEYCFLADVFPKGKFSIKAGELYQIYTQWCNESGHRPKSLRKFGPTIQTYGCKRSGKTGG